MFSADPLLSGVDELAYLLAYLVGQAAALPPVGEPVTVGDRPRGKPVHEEFRPPHLVERPHDAHGRRPAAGEADSELPTGRPPGGLDLAELGHRQPGRFLASPLPEQLHGPVSAVIVGGTGRAAEESAGARTQQLRRRPEATAADMLVRSLGMAPDTSDTAHDA